MVWINREPRHPQYIIYIANCFSYVKVVILPLLFYLMLLQNHYGIQYHDPNKAFVCKCVKTMTLTVSIVIMTSIFLFPLMGKTM